MTRQRAIEKVRKLLALAADRAATEPEKALARQRADELIAKHGLEQVEVAPEVVRPAPPPRPHPVYPMGQFVVVVSPMGNATGFSTTATGTWWFG